jgi:hypothetical protein
MVGPDIGQALESQQPELRRGEDVVDREAQRLRQPGREGDVGAAADPRVQQPTDAPRQCGSIRPGNGVQVAAEHGRSIDDDHYGATILAAPREAEVPPEIAGLIATPGVGREDYLTYGTAELRALIDRFLAAGASKFVVTPIATDLLPWLRELHAEVIGPVEAG